MNMIRAVIGVMVAAIVAVVATTGGGQAEVSSHPIVPVEREVQPSDPPNYLQEAKLEGVRLAAERRRNIYIWTVAVEKNRLEEEARIAEAKKKAAEQQQRVITAAAASKPVSASVAPTSGGFGNGDPNNMASWDRLAQCESGGNWAINTGNGYYGGLQFSLSSWRAVGGTGYPHEHSRETQIAMGQRLYAQGGWAHWPGCTRKFGWR